MNALGVWGQFFSMAILGLVLWAAVSDLLFRRIPNAAVVSIALVEAAALAAASLGGNGTAALGLLQSGSVWAVGVLIAGFLLYLTGRMGAGDVKLAAVLSFWAGFSLPMRQNVRPLRRRPGRLRCRCRPCGQLLQPNR